MMLKITSFAALLLLGTATFLLASSRRQPGVATEQRLVVDSIGWPGKQNGSAPRSVKKSCSEAYPVPDAAKHWTACQSGEYSQCGGPDDCACDDLDDRLTWYHCKEGSYAICEDDNTCKEGS